MGGQNPNPQKRVNPPKGGKRVRRKVFSQKEKRINPREKLKTNGCWVPPKQAKRMEKRKKVASA